MAVDLPAPSGPVKMLHGTLVVSAAIALECYAPLASFGVWLRSPHLLLQFYAPLAVVWAGCTHATAGAPACLLLRLAPAAVQKWYG